MFCRILPASWLEIEGRVGTWLWQEWLVLSPAFTVFDQVLLSLHTSNTIMVGQVGLQPPKLDAYYVQNLASSCMPYMHIRFISGNLNTQ